MKNIIKIVLIVAILVLNVLAIAPEWFNKPSDEKEVVQPKPQITQVTPMILPSVLKFS